MEHFSHYSDHLFMFYYGPKSAFSFTRLKTPRVFLEGLDAQKGIQKDWMPDCELP